MGRASLLAGGTDNTAGTRKATARKGWLGRSRMMRWLPRGKAGCTKGDKCEGPVRPCTWSGSKQHPGGPVPARAGCALGKQPTLAACGQRLSGTACPAPLQPGEPAGTCTHSRPTVAPPALPSRERVTHTRLLSVQPSRSTALPDPYTVHGQRPMLTLHEPEDRMSLGSHSSLLCALLSRPQTAHRPSARQFLGSRALPRAVAWEAASRRLAGLWGVGEGGGCGRRPTFVAAPPAAWPS